MVCGQNFSNQFDFCFPLSQIIIMKIFKPKKNLNYSIHVPVYFN